MVKVIQKYLLQSFGQNFICIATVKLFPIFHSFQIILLKPFTKMPSLNGYEKVTCENCGTQTAQLNLGVTSIVVLLVRFSVPNFPISQKNHKKNSFNILLRSTEPQNLMSPSSVNFGIKIFQDFTLHVNIETLNTECRSDQEQEMLMWNT